MPEQSSLRVAQALGGSARAAVSVAPVPAPWLWPDWDPPRSKAREESVSVNAMGTVNEARPRVAAGRAAPPSAGTPKVDRATPASGSRHAAPLASQAILVRVLAPGRPSPGRGEFEPRGSRGGTRSTGDADGNLARGRLQTLAAARDQAEPRAPTGELPNRGPSDPGRRAGHDDDLGPHRPSPPPRGPPGVDIPLQPTGP
jgi:hypothetical protein